MRKAVFGDMEAEQKPFVLLVIGGTLKNNYYELFKGEKVLGHAVQVEMARWEDFEVTNFSDSGALVAIRPAREPLPGTSMESHRTVSPSMLLVRFEDGSTEWI